MTIDRRRFVVGGVALALAACSSGAGDESRTGSGRTDGAAPSETPSTGAPAGVGSSGPTTSAAPSGAPARFVVRGADGDDRVALTFHTNGDLGLAERLLAALDAGGARATCFVVGDWLAANPAWGPRLVGAGHEVANHTWSHPTFATLPEPAMVDEVVRCRDTLADVAGTPGAWFRPSGTDDGTSPPADAVLAVAGAAGYTGVLGWDVEPYDYRDPGAAAVRDRVLAGVTGGSVVSLHFGHAGTVDALPGVLDGLASRGLRAVTASELLGAP